MNVLEKILEEIDTIKKEYDNEKYHQYFVDGANCAISDIRALIRSQMDDVPDINVGKWIPVSERLPDQSGYYLAFIYDHDLNMYIYDVVLFGRKKDNFKTDGWITNRFMQIVRAWMRLPKMNVVKGIIRTMNDSMDT